MSDVKIPEDIRQKVEAMFAMAANAEQVDHETGLPLVEAADAMTMVGRLVLAERERCAKIADACALDIGNFPYDFGKTDAGGMRAAEKIAAAIRSPHE